MPDQSTAWGSDIISKSTPKKRKHQGTTILNPEEKEIIEKFEESLQKSLTEKAAKSNLSQVAVKSLLKFVVTDENVIDLLRQKENDQDVSKVILYEPKITRSKAKELFNSSSSLLDVKWDESNETNAEVKGLLSDDLHEDSSDDEYVPKAEESDDDTSVCCSMSNPPTPIVNQNLLDEEVFKTPKAKQINFEKCDEKNVHKSDEDANIALRTRSKLSFSETPLEKIEQSFVPPDITNDMYDLECNDEDWKNFLNSFTQPLEEVVKNTEEDDLDPEYNILADEDITKVDTEELRDDRAVRVPKRELNALMAELYEYVDIYVRQKDFQQDNLEINMDPNVYPMQEVELDRYIEIFNGASNKKLYLNLEENITTTVKHKIISTDNPLYSSFSKSQFKLLEQQMCQHVQMLTQNFMLTFNHPYFSKYAIELKEYLLNFKLLSEGREISTFNTRNLKSALELIEKWEQNFENQNENAFETIQHFNKVMEESIQCYRDKKHYYLPFPDSLMRIISESDVFIYPQLLPKIPFKHPELQNCQFASFSLSEYTLVALGLEQFVQYLKDNREVTSQRKNISLAKAARIIQNMIMPARRSFQIYRSINENKKLKDPKNPISFYFKNKRAPFTVHQVIDLDQFGIVPPEKRPAHLLPRQWRFHIYHTYSMIDQNEIQTDKGFVPEPKVSTHLSQTQEPVVCRKKLPESKVAEIIPPFKLAKKKSEKDIENQKTYILQRKFKSCFNRTIPYVKYVYLEKNLEFFNKYFPQMIIVNLDISDDSMISSGTLPSMPCLDLLTLLEQDDEEFGHISEAGEEKPVQTKTIFDDERMNEINKIDTSKKEMSEEINDLMVAGPTLKIVKKDQLIVDKKKAKRRKEYLASIAMLAPLDPVTEKEKRENFSLAYMKKLKETLGLKEFKELLEVFIDDKVGDAVDLYRKLRPILIPDYQDLADEFLLFLTAEQACAVGQLIPFYIMNHMEKFLKNLELYFKDQPSQLRKVYKSLQDLSDTPDVNLKKIKSTILPLLKSNPLLCDSFLQMFLEESPTTTLLNAAWDVIDVNKELNRAKEEGVFENLAVTDDDSACTCNCHKTEGDVLLKQHCDNCGLRFIQGKVYCQTSKGMKPVNISFPLDLDVDHHARLTAPNKMRRIDPSSSKISNLSSKELMEDSHTNNENELEGKKRKVQICKSPKRTPKRKKFLKTKKSMGSPVTSEEKSGFNKNLGKKSDNFEETTHLNVKKTEQSSPVSKTDWKNLPSPEYINLASSDSDSPTEDETTVTKPIVEEVIKSEESLIDRISNRWTREEDRILLETFKQNFNKDPISLIKQRLKNRSESEILSRFDNLMTLLQEMYSREDYKISIS